MIHPTYRRLDEATRLAGFTLMQWAGLIVGGGGLGFVLHVVGVPTRPAISLWTLVVGAPGAIAYLSEGGRLPVGVIARDLLRWRTRSCLLPAGPAAEPGGLWITKEVRS